MKTQPQSTLTRRQLLASGAAASAASAIVTTSDSAEGFGLLQPPEGLVGDREVPTFCEICFWNCGVVASARGNRVLHLEGHPDHPLSRGKLCGRGNAGAGFVRDPDRLKHPMVRVGKRGEGRFERVGWKVAYQRIAEGFARIKERYGPEGLALFYHGKGGPMLRTMMVAYGTPNYAAPAYAQCKGPRDIGYKLTYGAPVGSPEPLDLDQSRCIVLFGSHLGENAHNSQVQQVVQAKARGASLIVLDPRMSTMAGRADPWLPVRPGSDTAVLLAWIHLLLKNETYHHAFVEHQCTGLEALKAHVSDFTPSWAADKAGVPAKDIERAYEMMVQASPAVVIHPGRHVTWYGQADTQRARAQAILTALLGAMWAPGGVYRTSAPELGDFPSPDFPDLPANVDKAAGRYPFAKELTTNGIRDATRTGKPYPIKGWFVHATNLIQSMPNVHHTLEAIDQLDMLVVCDIQPSEITAHADVLLPEDTYLERYDDLSVGRGKQPYICLRQPVVKPPHDTRPAWRIAKELGTELGVGEFFGFDTFEEYLTARLEGTGTTLAELKQKGIYLTKAKNTPYLDPAEDYHWHTPSGKVELYSKALADKGFDPLPPYEEQPLPPKGKLRLLYGRSPLHTFGRTQNNEILFDLDPGNCLWIHPKCAGALGITHGDLVMVRNGHGDQTGPMPAKVTERMQEQAVYMIHGFGHRSKDMHLACCSGGSDTDLIDDYAIDPITGSTGMRVQLVEVRPIDRGKEIYPCDLG